MAIKWGIAGASKISHDFCLALKSKQISLVEHKIVAIASRSQERANDFAKLHKIDKIYNSYRKLAEDQEINVVYIAVLNTEHFQVTKLMIEHGKNVVCEKPMTMNRLQTQSLISLAKGKTFLMEGLWSRFFPVYRHLNALIEDDPLRVIKEVYIKHGFDGRGSGRIEKKELGGGVVLDIGCYAIQFVLFVFRDVPKSIKAEGKVNASGVDLSFEATLTFSNDRMAKIICSSLGSLENQATVITTKGPICIPQYWCPTKYVDNGTIHQWDLNTDPSDTFHYTNSLGLKYEADEVSKCLQAGKLECDIVRLDESLLIASIQDEIRKQIGVFYDCDA